MPLAHVLTHPLKFVWGFWKRKGSMTPQVHHEHPCGGVGSSNAEKGGPMGLKGKAR